MYYLRTKSAVDAKKFTVTKEKKAQPVVVQEVAVDNDSMAQKKQKAAKTAKTFAKQKTENLEVEPMSAEEMKALIAQAKESEGDDCLMCGS